MNEEYKDLELVNNEVAKRFEMSVGEHKAIIEYKQNPHTMVLLHTEVPQQLEGKGAATAIIEKVLKLVETNQQKLIPVCPFVVAYVKRHPEWNRILDARAKDM